MLYSFHMKSKEETIDGTHTIDNSFQLERGPSNIEDYGIKLFASIGLKEDFLPFLEKSFEKYLKTKFKVNILHLIIILIFF